MEQINKAGQTVLDEAREIIRLEADAVRSLIDQLDDGFVRAVDLMYNCRGRVVVTGMGKSGLIGKKIAATLASTGTPSLFLHPAEGGHGDLGMVTRQDVVVALSNSGETEELLGLLPVIKRLGTPLIGVVGRLASTLARMSDAVLNVTVEREACPLNLAPTCSTTAALAMGDALAVALLNRRNFGPDDFALCHPGGNLGKRLLLRVADVMHAGESIPLVRPWDSIRDALFVMTDKRLGMTGVADGSGALVGVITDGDLRRNLEQGNDQLLTRTAGEIMTPNPIVISSTELAVVGVRRMQKRKITCLFVVNEAGELAGVLHLHDLLEAGLL
ncbi:MAG: KpsF/GutQ family sugar-phosphate isomerase [Magnetococcales bacterium]|nr:KpsF/GutQ family sugar-phosphate isomerase [Magnetococcales bacterium]